MKFSKNMKRSLLSAVAGTMMITCAITPVQAQETLAPITDSATSSSTSSRSLTTKESTTKSSSTKKSTSSSSRSSSSTTSATSSQKEEPLVAEGAELPEGQQYETATVDEGVVITGLGTVKITNGELIIPAEIDGKKVIEIGEKAFQNKDITKLSFEDGATLLKIGDSAFQGNDITGDLSIEVETIGNNAFAQNDIQSVQLHGIKQVGQDAFRDNKIDSIEFLPNLDETVNINDRAFINNRLSGEIDLTHAGEVGDEAFSTNKIRTVQVGDDTVLRDKVFANNGAWVEVKTSSGSDDTRGIETKSYDDKTGQVVDPVSIIIHYLDQDGKSIAPEQRIGDDLVNTTQAFEKGKEATFTPRKIQNYRLDTPEIVFTPDSDGYVIEAKYTYVDQRPVIEINRDGIELANGETPTREKLMQGVTAKDKDGNDITSNVKIDTSNVNIDAPGVYDVIYTVVDKNGNERIEKSSVTVGINWGEYEFGGGWQIKDFKYDGDTLLGFSDSGDAKRRAGNTELWIPPVNTSGKEVKKIREGSYSNGAFDANSITAIKDWGNITSIGGYAFSRNRIKTIPDNWGQITSISKGAFDNNLISTLPDNWGQITSISESAFKNNHIETIPDDWGQIKSIGFSAFSSNQLSSLPDDWGQVTSIGNSAFSRNQITSIPDDWGDITSIGDSAFRNNQLSSIPDDWGQVTSIGNYAFNNNQLSSLPDDWGQVTSIGFSAFSSNQITSIPDDWGDITRIGSNAFAGNQLSSIPDDWGNITSIGDSAFRNNQLSSIPDDWGQVTSIGDNAFSSNKIVNLPDTWGSITSIGEWAFYYNQIVNLPDTWGSITSISNSAFQNNQINILPDNWGNITNIGNQAFYKNQLTSLPDDWGQVTSIDDSAFSSNQLSSIPDDWGNITSIGGYAFRDNKLSSLPDDWGQITSISNAAFRNNELSSLPDSWSNIISIGSEAFRDNKLSSLPDSWGNITSIGREAFYSNHLPSNMTFIVNPENLTQEFIKGINTSLIPKPLTLITTDRSNPNNVKSPKGDIFINPVRVTYRYLDDDGKEITNSRTEIQSSDEQVSYEAPTTLIALGYQPVEKSITYTVGRNDTQTVDVVYKKIEVNEDTNTNITLRLNNKDPYKIGTDMTGNIQIDRTGFDTEPLVNTRVYLTVDPNVYDLNSFGITTSSLNINTNTFKREGNTFSFVVPLLNPSQSTTIPFRVKFRENFTPSKTDHPITATLVSEQGEVIRISNKESFQGYYNQPYQRIYANGQKQYGLIDDYEQTIVSNDGANPVSFVADDREGEKVKNTITYQITNTDIHRNVGDYETRVMIPTYEVHEQSKIYDADNPRKLATFDPARNSGWVLSEDGTYVIYKGNNKGTAEGFTDQLIFGYPGAKENQRITVRSETTLIPDNKPDTEPVMFTSDNITNHFARYTPPPGKIIAKFPTGNHGGTSNNYFYDNTLERNGNFPWIIPFNATQTFTNAMFRDFDLDERMYYDTVTVPQNLGDVEVRVIDARGATLQSQKITRKQSRTVAFDKNRVIKGTELQIELLEHDLVKGTQGTIELTSRLKNPDIVIYDDPNQSTIFPNRAALTTAQGEFGPVYAQKTVKKNIQEIAAFKTQQGYDAEGNKVDQLITDDLIRYTVGFTPREGMGETITNIEEVDLLPLNIDVNDVTLSSSFAKLPGAKYRVVENYNNSGQTAVVFTADSATPDQLNPGSRFNVGTITVRTNMSIPDGRIDNDVFVRANNTGLANKVTDPRLGNDEWSYANVWSNYTAASDMSARKQIRTYDENNEALNWTASVITEPGAKIDYKLRLDNGTENERGQLVIYDVFPHVGDVGIPNPRESKFANTYDPTREPVIPEGYSIQYYNGDDFPSHPAGVEAQKESNRVLSALQWDDTPTVNTKAVRIVQNEGVKIGSRDRVEFILPMRANAERLDEYGNPPADLIGVSAYNTFFWKDDHQPVLIEGNRVENQLKKKPISVQLRKVAQSSNQPLSGARFELRDVEDNVVAAATSDEQGYVRFNNVEIKTQYTVREVLAPKGYQLSSQVITLTNDMIAQGYAKNPAVIDLGNYVNVPTPPAPKYGEVEFTKVDVDGNPLPGTKFQLHGSYRSSYATYEATANKDGKVIFAGVTPDTSYTLSEIQPVGKLQPINNITNIKVEGDKTTYLGTTVNGIENAVINDKVKIILTKLGVNDDRIYNQNGTPKPFGTYQGTDGSKLSGATFQVIDDATGNVVSTVSSSSYYDRYIENLTPGKVYRLNETQVPNNYEKVDGLDLRFKVDAKGTILHPDGTPMEIQNGIYVPNRNKTQESTVTVLKVDQDKNPVANAVFALQRKENDKWVQVGDTKTSGEDGVVSWNTNDSARYRIVETKAPAGYIGKYVSQEFLTQRTSAKTFSYTAVNNRIRPEVAKVEFIAQNLPTREAAMEIRDKNNGSVVEGNSTSWNVVRYLEGAVIEVRENDAQGALIQTITTDSTGKAQITADIDPQKNYVLVETQAPEGYELRTQPLTFNATTRLATDPTAKNGSFTVFVPNYKKNGRIVVSKLNESTGNPITGVQATFEALRVNLVDGQPQDDDIEINGVFYRPTSRTITQKTSSSAGVASFNNLDYGTYIVRETASPNGYVLDATPALFTVDENNASHTFVFNNVPENPEVDITKYINGHDANNDITAVWLENNADTMDVKTVVENTGNTKLEKVTITDAIRDTDDQYINEALKTAMFTIRDADGNLIAENVANGDITLNPGDTVETTVTVASPEKGKMHRDDATVVGYYGDIEVTDEDPAHAYRIPDVAQFILPATGAIPRFGIISIIVMVLFGIAGSIAMRRRNIM